MPKFRFNFAQISPQFWTNPTRFAQIYSILPPKTLLGDAAASPAPTALFHFANKRL